MSRNRDFFHPYYTRSKSRGHANHLSLEDTHSKESITEGKLLSSVQATLFSRKKIKEDKTSIFKQKVEGLKNKLKVNNILPLMWNGNLFTANTHVPRDMVLGSLVSVEGAGGVPQSSVLGQGLNHPNIHTASLKRAETKSWKHLVKLYDEGKLEYLPDFKIAELEEWFQVDIGHPFVRVIGSFALNSFNKAYEMMVEKGNHNQLTNPAFTACKMFKSGGFAEVIITVEALEEGFCGIYDGRVMCKHNKLTLMEFNLTGKKVVEGASTSKNPKAVKSLSGTGMVRRSDGYDYFNPSERIIG